MGETLSEHEQTQLCLDYALNHERKIGALAILDSFTVEEGDAPLAFYVSQRFNEWQGDEPVWPTNPGSIAKYLDENFKPGKLVTTEEGKIGPKRKTERYHLNEQHGPLLRALVRHGIEWSLDNPDFSVQQMLGNTASSGQTRPPSSRVNLYRRLSEPREWIRQALTDYHKEFGYKDKAIATMGLDTLRTKGLLVIDSDTSHVRLAGEVAGPIREFCTGIDTILKNATEREAYADGLRELTANPKIFAALIAKGKKFSTYRAADADPNTVATYISEVLPRLIKTSTTGRVSAREIRNHLETSMGRTITVNRLNQVLSEMRRSRTLPADVLRQGSQAMHWYVAKKTKKGPSQNRNKGGDRCTVFRGPQVPPYVAFKSRSAFGRAGLE